MEVDRESVEEIIKRLPERMLPSVVHTLTNPQTGLAVGILFFTAWTARKALSARRMRSLEDMVRSDEELIVELSQRVKQLRRHVEELESLVNDRSLGEGERRRLERSLSTARRELERLEEELELAELRVLAARRIASLGDPLLKAKAFELVKKIVEGKPGLEDAQFQVLQGLEEQWRRRQLALRSLRQLVEEG